MGDHLAETMGAPSAGTWAVVVSGSLAGGVAKGVTGFGSAIVLVLFWVVAVTLGVDSGETAWLWTKDLHRNLHTCTVGPPHR